MMRPLHNILLTFLLATGLLLGLISISRVGALATPAKTEPHLKLAGQANTDFRPSILATNRISIPFGIQPALPLGLDGSSVLVRGHGGCTKNELVTVQITVTQATGPVVATGQKEEPCTGVLQH
jgi:hypothetical protein